MQYIRQLNLSVLTISKTENKQMVWDSKRLYSSGNCRYRCSWKLYYLIYFSRSFSFTRRIYGRIVECWKVIADLINISSSTAPNSTWMTSNYKVFSIGLLYRMTFYRVTTYFIIINILSIMIFASAICIYTCEFLLASRKHND